MEQVGRGGGAAGSGRGRRKRKPGGSNAAASNGTVTPTPAGDSNSSGRGRGRKRKKGRGGQGRGGADAASRESGSAQPNKDVTKTAEVGAAVRGGHGKGSRGGGAAGGKKRKREPRGKKAKESDAKQKALDEEQKLKEAAEAEARAAEAEARAARAEKEAAEKRRREEEERRAEQRRKRRKDIVEAAEQVREGRKQRRQKREVRQKNLCAGDHRPTKEFLKSLDSGIKKNTSLIKKVKHSVTEENIASICKDIQRLNLSRYVSEVVSAIAELKMKGSDVDAVVQLCSLMHQRYSEFSEDLVQQLAKKISAITQDTAKTMKKMPDQEKKDLFLKRRAWLKLLVELFVNGVTEDSDLVLDALSAIVDSAAKRFSDSDSAYYDLWLQITFARSAAEDILGLAPGLPTPLVELRELQERLDNRANDVEVEEAGEKEPCQDGVSKAGEEGLEGHGEESDVSKKRECAEDDDTSAEDAEDRAFVDEFKDLLVEMETVPVEKEIVTEEVREQFWAVVRRYWERLSKVILKLHERLRDKEEDNHVTLQTKGVLPEGAADAYEQNLKIFEKLVSTASQLAEQLQLAMVELPKDDKRTRITSQVSLLNSNLERIEQESVFDDEDTRSFYEDLLDLRAMLPAVLFGEAPDCAQSEGEVAAPIAEDTEGGELEGTEADQEAPLEEREGVDKEDEEVEDIRVSSSLMDDDDDDDQEGEEDTTAAAVAAGLARKNKLDELLVTMQNSVNRDLIDAVAVDFCYVNSKSSRKKLVKGLYSVGRNKLVLLPYYARLAATLNKCMPDIGPALVELLEREFRFLKKKKDQQDLESKVKNIRYLSELVMFKVCPVSVIFNCLRVLCAEFIPHNIEVTCNLLETCGRFLYRSPETHVRTNNLLTTLFRLKSAKYLDSRLETMLENAYYHCKPPERAAIQRKVRPPMQEYIRHLLYSELSKATMKRVLLQLRKLPWDEQEDYVVRCLCKPWKVTYSAVPPLANVVASLSKFNSSLGVRVVDLVLEDIYCSLYGPVDASKNQRRVTTVRFLGELYYFCMVDANVIFDVLYTLIIEDPARHDDPRDCFPIRLICTLLSTCGQYFDRGASKKRLDRYLIYFQQYYFARPFIPIDIEYMVADAFDLIRPKLKRFTIAAQADEAVEKLIAMPRPTKGGGQLHVNPVRPGRFLVSSSSENFDDEEEEEEDDEEEAEEEEEPAVQSVVETQDYVRTTPGFHKQSEKVTEEDEEFDRMFKSMLQQSMDSRRLEPRGAGLTMVPTNLMTRDSQADESPSETDTQAATPSLAQGKGVMKFRLLMKKGNKPTAVGLEVPVESPLVIHTQAKMAEEKEAREDIKRYVLDYEKQEEQETFNSLGVTHTGTGKERMSQKQRRAQQAGRIYSSTQRPYLRQQ